MIVLIQTNGDCSATSVLDWMITKIQLTNFEQRRQQLAACNLKTGTYLSEAAIVTSNYGPSNYGKQAGKPYRRKRRSRGFEYQVWNVDSDWGGGGGGVLLF